MAFVIYFMVFLSCLGTGFTMGLHSFSAGCSLFHEEFFFCHFCNGLWVLGLWPGRIVTR